FRTMPVRVAWPFGPDTRQASSRLKCKHDLGLRRTHTHFLANHRATGPLLWPPIQLRRTQRNFADRARGLAVRSAQEARIGSSLPADQMPERSPARKDVFTSRSSPLWKLMIAVLPPARRQLGRTRSRCS